MGTAKVLLFSARRQGLKRPARDPARVAENRARAFIPLAVFKSVQPRCLMARKGISLGAKACWGRLAKFAGANGDCFPSYEKLAREMGIGRRRVIDLVAELEDADLIVVDLPKPGRRTMSFVFSRPDWMNEDAPATSAKQITPTSVKQITHRSVKQITVSSSSEDLQIKKNSSTPHTFEFILDPDLVEYAWRAAWQQNYDLNIEVEKRKFLAYNQRRHVTLTPENIPRLWRQWCDHFSSQPSDHRDEAEYRTPGPTPAYADEYRANAETNRKRRAKFDVQVERVINGEDPIAVVRSTI